jgi:hypothetical protein
MNERARSWDELTKAIGRKLTVSVCDMPGLMEISSG